MISHKKTKFVAVLGLLSLILTALHGESILFVQTAAATATDPGNLQDFTRNASIAQVFLLGVTYMMLHFNGLLLNPKFVYEVTDMTAGNALNELWVVSRDIMNTLFAFMLVFAALFTIVRADSTMVKEKLGRFVIAVILVNFSWYFPRVILDASNVLAVSVWNLPNAVGVNCTTNAGAATCKAVDKIFFDTRNNGVCGGAGSNRPCACQDGVAVPPGSNILKPAPNVCVVLRDMTTTNTSIGVLNGLFLNHMRVVDFHRVNPAPSPTGSGTTFNVNGNVAFIMSLMFAILFTVMTVFPLIAIFFGLIVRVPILWITIMLMPFMFVGFVGGEFTGKFNTQKIFEEFLKAAFLPVVVGAPIALGYIMIGKNGAGVNSCPASGLINQMGFCDPQIGLVSGIQNLWELLWNFLALGVIWMGVFKAMNSMGGIYASIANRVESVGKNWGKFALKAPLAVNGLPGNANIASGVLGGIQNPEAFIGANGKFRNAGEIADLLRRGQFGGSGSGSGVDSVVNNVRNNVGGVQQDIKNIITGNQNPADAARALAEQLRRLPGGNNLNATQIKEAARKAGEAVGQAGQRLEDIVAQIQ